MKSLMKWIAVAILTASEFPAKWQKMAVKDTFVLGGAPSVKTQHKLNDCSFANSRTRFTCRRLFQFSIKFFNLTLFLFFLFVCWFISGLNIDTRIYQQNVDVDVDVSWCIFVSAVSLYICIKSCHDCNNTRFPSFETYVDINNNFPDSLSLLKPFPPILLPPSPPKKIKNI